MGNNLRRRAAVGSSGELEDTPLVPIFDFTQVGTLPFRVDFVDKSEGNPTQWSWDFGDGATSSSQNPTHTYGGPGPYEASLAIRKITAISGKITQTVEDKFEKPKPTAKFDWAITQALSTTPEMTVQFTDRSTVPAFSAPLRPSEPPIIPTWDFTIVSTVGTGMVVRFNNTTVPDVAEWDWRLGDSRTSILKSFEYTYSSKGPFIVSVRAKI